MPDDQSTNQPAETPAESTEQTPEGGNTPEEKPEAPKADEPKEDDLPEWARNELKKVRSEAANYRTRLRDAEGKLQTAKTPEEFEAAINEFKASNAELERQLLVTKVAAKYDLPPELAARLQGADESAIEADAKALAAFVTPKHNPESVSGGLTPGESDDSFDPVAEARKARMSRY